MGIFDFIRSAGRVLTGQPVANAQPAVQDESKSAPLPPTAEAVQAELRRVGLDAQQIEVRVEGDTVHLRGSATSAEEKEKLILAAGNIAGVAKVDEEISTQDTGPQPTFYTVKRGDTLSKIAQQHYGAANEYHKIFEANRPMLTDPDRIYPGQVLRIPPRAA